MVFINLFIETEPFGAFKLQLHKTDTGVCV